MSEVNFLVDNIGDIVIDGQGKFVEIQNEDLVRQRIINIFQTQRGSEFYIPEYGFDRVSYIRNIFIPMGDSLYYYVMEALSPDTLYGITSVSEIETYIEESTSEDGRTKPLGKVSMSVIYNNNQIPMSLNVRGE